MAVTTSSQDNLVARWQARVASFSVKEAPEEWAEAMHHLGNAFQMRHSGDRAADIEEAIDAYQKALEVRTREAAPREWAETMANLGHAYSDRMRGAEADNLQSAINCFERSLEVLTREVASVEWAQIRVNIATIYSSGRYGDRAEGVERAIYLYRDALEVLTRETAPECWALVTGNLGNAYSRRLRGDRAENLERALGCHRLALEVESRARDPWEWASTQMNLGTVYCKRHYGDPDENIESAIRAFEQALQVRTREHAPWEWAEVMHNLGTAYVRRQLGDRAANLERAIVCLGQALEVRTRELSAIEWSQSMDNLGTAYLNRIEDDRAANIERAVDCYQEILETLAETEYPYDWAAASMNLATAYRNRIDGERTENLEQALEYCRAALRVRTRESMPDEWATAMMNLGIIYTHRIHGDRADNLERSIGAYQSAFEVRERESAPFDWALLKMNLATAFQLRIKGDSDRNMEAAIEAYEDALKIFRPESLPVDSRKTAAELGRLYFQRGSWDAAAAAFSRAVEATEILYRGSLLPRGREAELAVAPDLDRDAAAALARAGRLEEAVLTLERGRARGLRNALERDRADLDKLAEDHTPLHDAYRNTVTGLRRLEVAQRAETPLPPGSPPRPSMDVMHGEAKRLRVELESVLDQIRTLPGQEGFLRMPGLPELAEAVEIDRPLLYLLTGVQGSLAFIVRRSPTTKDIEVEVLSEEGFTEKSLDRILAKQVGDKIVGGLIPEQFELEYNERRFKTTLENGISFLETQWLGRIAARLKDLKIGRISLIPCGRLALLPIHAVFLDDFDVLQVPSARVGHIARRQLDDRATARPRLVAVSDVPSALSRPLPYARSEVGEIYRITEWEGHDLSGEGATKASVTTALDGATHLHLACHGAFDLAQPLSSFVELADGGWTLREILDDPHMDTVRLVVLSACQTGLSEWNRLPDEVIGLAAGFLQAGVPGVVATLWPIVDLSTALLMSRFYRYLHHGDFPQEALRRSQSWLRELTVKEIREEIEERRSSMEGSPRPGALEAMFPDIMSRLFLLESEARPFSSPYYWAAFVFFGR